MVGEFGEPAPPPKNDLGASALNSLNPLRSARARTTPNSSTSPRIDRHPVVFFFPCGNSVPEKKKRDTIFYSVLKSTAHNDSNNQRQGRYVL